MSFVTNAKSTRMRRRREPSRAASRPIATPAAREDQHPRRRELGQSQDQALYSCGCGFVFDAPVSTSVDCPHCGDTQAW